MRYIFNKNVITVLLMPAHADRVQSAQNFGTHRCSGGPRLSDPGGGHKSRQMHETDSAYSICKIMSSANCVGNFNVLSSDQANPVPGHPRSYQRADLY